MITKYKNRYVLIESSDTIDINDSSTSHGLINSLDQQVGEMGHAELNPKLVYQYNGKVFIMRVNRGSEKKAILAISFIKNINGKKVGLYTIKTSGTIKSLVNYCKKTY